MFPVKPGPIFGDHSPAGIGYILTLYIYTEAPPDRLIVGLVEIDEEILEEGDREDQANHGVLFKAQKYLSSDLELTFFFSHLQDAANSSQNNRRSLN
jgi:hypothetical protein